MQLSSPLQSPSCAEIHQVITHRVVMSGYLTDRRGGQEKDTSHCFGHNALFLLLSLMAILLLLLHL